MNRTLLAAALILLALVPAFALAHPPAADPQNSCVVKDGTKAERTPGVLVNGTLSYLDFPGRSLPPCKPYYAEFGSHASACPAPPATGPVFGAYCGPLVLPGDTATCTWNPLVVRMSFDYYGLIIGFDRPNVTLPAFNGLIRLSEGEVPVFGPFLPGAWTVTNPYPGTVARVIAYPTNQLLPPHPEATKLSPPDLHEIICVTP